MMARRVGGEGDAEGVLLMCARFKAAKEACARRLAEELVAQNPRAALAPAHVEEAAGEEEEREEHAAEGDELSVDSW